MLQSDIIVVNMRHSSIIVTGSISYDEIMDFPGKFKDHFHPERLHQINVSFVVNHLERQLGGTATNIIYNLQLALACLSVQQKVILLSSVGKDGEPFVDFFTKHSINTQGLLVDESLYSAKGTVITDITDNQIWGFYYGACKSAAKIKTMKYADPESLLIVAANHKDSFLHFQNDAINNKLEYFYDPGMSLSWISDNDLRKGVMNAKYIVGNDYEIAMIMKRLNLSVDHLVKKGIAVITTLGEKGVRYESKSQITNNKLQIKAFKVKKVIDPTGAGDAWRGGFIAGLVAGLTTKDCLKLGNVMASFAIESYGTVNHRPSKKEIQNRLKSL